MLLFLFDMEESGSFAFPNNWCIVLIITQAFKEWVLNPGKCILTSGGDTVPWGSPNPALITQRWGSAVLNQLSSYHWILLDLKTDPGVAKARKQRLNISTTATTKIILTICLSWQQHSLYKKGRSASSSKLCNHSTMLSCRVEQFDISVWMLRRQHLRFAFL